MPGTKEVTHVMLEASYLRGIHPILPALGSTINVNGVLCPTLITQFLSKILTTAHFNEVIKTDRNIRNTQGPLKLPYRELINYSAALILSSYFIIKNFEQLKNSNDNILTLTSYVLTYTTLYRCNLDKHYDYICAMENALEANRLNAKDVKEIQLARIKAYQAIEIDYTSTEGFFAAYKTIIDESIPASWLYQYYQTQLDVRIYRAQTENLGAKAILKALGTDALVARLEALDARLAQPGFELQTQLLKAKEAYHIKRKTALALDRLGVASEKLEQYRLTHFKDGNYEHFKNNFTVLHLSILNDGYRNIENIGEVFRVAIQAKDTISQASAHLKFQFSSFLAGHFDAAIKIIDTQLKCANLPLLDKLQSLLSDILLCLPLYYEAVDLSSEKEKQLMRQPFSDIFNELHSCIVSKKEMILKKDVEASEQLAALEVKIQEYNNKFEAILKQFHEQAKEKMSKKVSHVMPVPLLPVEKSEPEVAPVKKEVVISLSDACRQYVAQYGVDQGQAFINQYTDSVERATATLYIGDWYFYQNRIEEALSMYESALDQCNLFDERNPMLDQSIMMMLEISHDLIENQLQNVIEYEQWLRAERQGFIMYLGMQALQCEGYTDSQLNAPSKKMKDMIRSRGDLEFKSIGQKKHDQGKPLSESAMARYDAKYQREMFQSMLEKSKDLRSRLTLEGAVQENFPALSRHHSALFKEDRLQPAQSSTLKTGQLRKNGQLRKKGH